jgi:predicted Na+-dependent transporter
MYIFLDVEVAVVASTASSQNVIRTILRQNITCSIQSTKVESNYNTIIIPLKINFFTKSLKINLKNT